jgi:hypothetical protein
MFIIFPQDTCIFNFGAMTAIQLIAFIQRRSMPERLSVIRTQFSIKHKKILTGNNPSGNIIPEIR